MCHRKITCESTALHKGFLRLIKSTSLSYLFPVSMEDSMNRLEFCCIILVTHVDLTLCDDRS